MSILARIALLAAVYYATGRLGLLLPIAHQNVTLVWAPSGIAVAAILLWGFRVWPGIALGAFLVNLATSAPFGVCLAMAAGNTLLAVAGAWLLRRAGFHPALDRVGDVLSLGLCAALAPAVSATFGTAALAWSGLLPPGRAFAVWGYWWLGDAMGILLVTPVLSTWTVVSIRPGPSGGRRLEAGLLVAALLAASSLTLSTWSASPILHPPLAFTIFPFLVWAALRFGQRGATALTLLAVAVAVWAVTRGLTPFFTAGTAEERLVYLHTYMAVAAVTSMLLAAGLAERVRTEEELRRAKLAAETANAAKDRFIAALSHELRTPLTPVLAVVSRLEEDERLRPVRDDLGMVRRNVDLEARLIDDLLRLTGESPEPHEVSASPPAAGQARPAAARSGPLRILLVEDHADTAQAMAELLRLLGDQVVVAASVTQGLAAAEAAVNAGGLDLVVSDLGLPDGNGAEMMRELVRRYGLPGIAVSGYGMEEDVRRSLEAGFSRHLTKPVSLQALQAAIREVVGPPPS